LIVTLEGFGRKLGRVLAVEARAAHDRFGLTHMFMVRAKPTVSKLIRGTIAAGDDRRHDFGADGGFHSRSSASAGFGVGRTTHDTECG
jgi:hypothetical protein